MPARVPDLDGEHPGDMLATPRPASRNRPGGAAAPAAHGEIELPAVAAAMPDGIAAVEEMLGYLLRRANSMYHQYWADNFSLPDGTLTPMQAGMLLAIHQWGPITQTELAQRLKIKLPSALHSTNHLEAQHYVTRSARADDRRSYTLGLTPAGEAALRAVAAMSPVRDEALLAPLSAEERTQLRSLLTRIVAREA